MTEKSGFSAFIRRKLIKIGWLPKDKKVKTRSRSLWDTPPALWWTDLQNYLHQFVKSFVYWFYTHVLGKGSPDGQATIPANELLPGFMETGEAHAWVEFDNQHQMWMVHLDFTHESLTCHLEMVNQESIPIMKKILSTHQPEAPPAK